MNVEVGHVRNQIVTEAYTSIESIRVISCLSPSDVELPFIVSDEILKLRRLNGIKFGESENMPCYISYNHLCLLFLITSLQLISPRCDIKYRNNWLTSIST